MNPYIIYNGVSSETMGVIITELPTWHRAARRVSEQTIPGRSGAVVQDDGGYDMYSATLRLNVNGADERDVRAWLRGEGWMISSDEDGYKAYVYVYGQIDVDRMRIGSSCYDNYTVNLRVDPYLRETDEAALTFTTNDTFGGKGHDNSAPLIAVTGSGSPILMVNSATVYLLGLNGTLYLDAETGTAYTIETDETTQLPVMVFAGTHVGLEEGEWPYLLPAGGVNLISWTGSITKVEIQPNWRYL